MKKIIKVETVTIIEAFVTAGIEMQVECRLTEVSCLLISKRL